MLGFFEATIDSLGEHVLKIVLVGQVANSKNVTLHHTLVNFITSISRKVA